MALSFLEQSQLTDQDELLKVKEQLSIYFGTPLNLNDFDQIFDCSKKVATKIESCLFEKHCAKDDKISAIYGKRYRDLLVGLKNQENELLRLSLITGGVKAHEFIEFDKDKLAPRSLL